MAPQPLSSASPGLPLNSDGLTEPQPEFVAYDSSWGAAWES